MRGLEPEPGRPPLEAPPDSQCFLAGGAMSEQSILLLGLGEGDGSAKARVARSTVVT